MKADIKLLINAFSEVFKAIHQRSYHKLDDKNLYPGQPKLLSLIKAHEGITQKELSEKNCVTPASITGMLNKLEANNYVYRVPDEEDKRIMRVFLTKEGHEHAVQAEQFMHSLMEQLFEGFSEEELKSFVMLAEKMRNNFVNHQKP